MPLLEPLVPELSRNHFEGLVAVPLKWLKPNYGSVFDCRHENDLTHINAATDIAHGPNSKEKTNNLLEKFERILILAGPQIDIDEANTIRSFGRGFTSPYFGRSVV